MSYFWQNETMFLFTYHARPLFEADYLGAYVNCWIMDQELKNAQLRSEKLIEAENWLIDQLEEVLSFQEGEYPEDGSERSYYEQAIIHKEILVFHTYDKEED